MRDTQARSRTRPGHKVVTAAEAVRLIPDGATLATGGFIGIGFPEGLAIALEQRFLGQDPLSPSGSPSGLTLVYAGGQGDGKDRGLSMERKALTLDTLAIAMATHNAGGIVIMQVERLAQAGSLPSRQVRIPGILVDLVVLAEKPEHHMQTFAEPYSPVFSGELLAPPMVHATTPLNMRKIMTRRAALELRPHDIVSLN